MGVSSVMQWWNLWQLQVYVLASLGIQYLLTILGALRRRRMPTLFRLFTWISFASGDSMVLSALGVLFWKLYTSSSADGSNDLEVFWAPILLMHLGGQMCITVYNLNKDNEAWAGQILILLSKVTGIIYVFCNLWSPSADNRLLVAAILLLISGTIKCIDKIINLKNSSFNNLSTTLNDVLPSDTSRQLGLEEYVQQSRNFFKTWRYPERREKSMPLHSAEKLFVDHLHSYSDRLDNLTSFWALDSLTIHDMIKSGLATTFELLYTKSHAARIMYVVIRSALAHTFKLLYTRTRALPGIGRSLSFELPYTRNRAPRIDTSQLPHIDSLCLVTWASSTGLPVVAIGLFHSIDKQAYRGADVIVTLLLLYGTLALEFISVYLVVRSSGEWPDMVAQHSLFGFFAHNKKHSNLMRFARFLHCKDFLDRYWCMDACHSSEDIIAIAGAQIIVVWTNNIKDGQSYMDHAKNRGHWTMKRMGLLPLLGWSIDKPFDESVLLWHIATEFLLHSNTEDTDDDDTRCRQMSNYMVHLLFDNPEMLLSGSRKSLFTEAYNQLSDILSGEGTCDDADKLVQKIIAKLLSGKVSSGTLVYDAWLLAQNVMTMDYINRWVIIRAVWVEMLCFSAGRCGGYLHAKSLGSGGELLSVVSLLLAYSGMPTLPDRNQDAPFGYSSSSASGHGDGGQGTSATAASASGHGDGGQGTSATAASASGHGDGGQGTSATAASASGPRKRKHQHLGGNGATAEHVRIVAEP